MRSRPATPDDVAVATELTARSDTAWFGAPEQSEDEVREYFDQVHDFEAGTRVVTEDDRVIAVALRNDTDAWWVIDPDESLRRAVADDLVDWFAASAEPKMEVLDRDHAVRGALESKGWKHQRSSFELVRPVTEDWVLDEPRYPTGVEVRDFTVDDAAAMYHLIYVDAGWTDVPGHPHRDFDGWRSLFITDSTVPAQQVLAWRGDRLVGVSIGRIFSDGTGWVAQLAVSKDERGNGLGRALLLDSLHRRRAAGATALGLAVQAENRGALSLYLATGLQIDREWMEYHPSPSNG